MFNASDYILDEKVRKAAAHYPALYLIPEWKQLEVKLDIELPVKKKRRRLIVFWLLFSGLLTGASYIVYIGNLTEAKNKETADVISTNSTNNTKPVSEQINHSIQGQHIYQDSSTKKLTQTDNTENLTTDKSLTSKLTGNKNADELITTTANKKSLFGYEEIIIKQKRNKQTFKKEKKSNTIDESNQDETNLNTITVGRFLMEDKVSVYNGLDTNTVVSNNEKDSIAIASTFIDSNAISGNKIAREKTVKKNSSRFSISVLGGINLNSVQFNNPSKAGLDYGLLVGYRISPKLEVRTGLIFSKKYFTTTGNNISFDSTKLNLPSYNTISLEDATGYCRFMEVPVMLYYQFSSKRKINFYAAGGFSINRMRMESVHYTFLADGNTIVERSHTSARHNKSDFSTSVTSNFSIGLKYNFNTRWNISAEPYLRLPLTRFNNNNLRFSTFGTMLSVTYNLPGSKKK
ncbi:MAG: PorT family protein [Chitinophagaceae bacterium]|nr:PorT family protein [Chitinophagaceae bacterium]